MHTSQLRTGSIGTRRLGSVAVWMCVGVAVAATVAYGGYTVLQLASGGETEDDALTHTVAVGTFHHDITARGQLESAQSHEIRNEVKSRNGGGTQIIWIIPEGTFVKPGDDLVHLDSSPLDQEHTQQRIICNTSKAILIQAKNAYETAVIAKKEYLEGTYRQEEQLVRGEVFVAEETLRRAEEYHRYSQRLAAKGYATSLQLEADAFAVDKARNELGSARTKLKVLAEFTKVKMLKQLESDIASAKAKWDAETDSYELEQKKLNEIKEQINKCTIVADREAEVIYANERDRRGNDEVAIEPGLQLRERQVIIRLPDSTQMQVATDIYESQIGSIRVGQRATVRVDAFPDLHFPGTVVEVGRYAERSRWSGSNVKKYETIILLDGTDPRLKVGLTTEVMIHVDEQPDVLQIPVQSVARFGGRDYCAVRTAGGWQPRPLTIGATNDKHVIVDGVQAGEVVAMAPKEYLDENALRGRAADEPVQVAKAESPPPSRGPGGKAGAAGRKKSQPFNPAEMVSRYFQQYDANTDRKLSREEFPDSLRQRFDAMDRNHDKVVDRGELAAGLARMKQEGAADAGSLFGAE